MPGFIGQGDLRDGEPAGFGEGRRGDRGRGHRQVDQVECSLEAGDASGADELVEVLGGDGGHGLVDHQALQAVAHVARAIALRLVSRFFKQVRVAQAGRRQRGAEAAQAQGAA